MLAKLECAKDKTYSLSETEKKALVENLYQKMPKKSSYFQRFYETLEILDACYMSERKNEAQRIFREIYTVPAVVKSKLEDFKRSLEDFAKISEFNYTKFKIDVLSKYVVNIDMRRYLFDNRLHLSNVSNVVYELEEVSDDRALKLKKWLSDIYVFDGEYQNDIGVFFKKNEEIIGIMV